MDTRTPITAVLNVSDAQLARAGEHEQLGRRGQSELARRAACGTTVTTSGAAVRAADLLARRQECGCD